MLLLDQRSIAIKKNSSLISNVIIHSENERENDSRKGAGCKSFITSNQQAARAVRFDSMFRFDDSRFDVCFFLRFCCYSVFTLTSLNSIKTRYGISSSG